MIQQLETIAQRGDAAAALALGVVNEYQGRAAGSQGEAEKWYAAAAEAGSIVARYALARLLSRIPDRHKEAIRHAEVAANAGLAESALFLAVCFETGHCVVQDHEKAKDWNRKAAELGNPWGWYHLGMQFVRERGEIESPEIALNFFLKGASQSHTGCMYYAARIFLEYFNPARVTDALNLLKDACARLDYHALVYLADMARSKKYNQLDSNYISEVLSQIAGSALPQYIENLNW
jgi:TPR repeat protein